MQLAIWLLLNAWKSVPLVIIDIAHSTWPMSKSNAEAIILLDKYQPQLQVSHMIQIWIMENKGEIQQTSVGIKKTLDTVIIFCLCVSQIFALHGRNQVVHLNLNLNHAMFEYEFDVLTFARFTALIIRQLNIQIEKIKNKNQFGILLDSSDEVIDLRAQFKLLHNSKYHLSLTQATKTQLPSTTVLINFPIIFQVILLLLNFVMMDLKLSDLELLILALFLLLHRQYYV